MPGTRKSPVQREWADQRAHHAFLSKALPLGAYYTAIDVGGSKSVRLGQLRKARGVKAGIPDALIVYQGTTLWLEFKAGSSLSDAQKLTRDALRDNGHLWALCHSTEDIEAECLAAGIPLRATLGGIRERIAEQNERLGIVKRKRAVRNPTATRGQMTLAQYRRANAKQII